MASRADDPLFVRVTNCTDIPGLMGRTRLMTQSYRIGRAGCSVAVAICASEGWENQMEVTMDGSEAARDQDRLVWTVEETAQLLGISRAHAYDLVARDELPHLRLGRRVVVPKHALEALLARVGTHT